ISGAKCQGNLPQSLAAPARSEVPSWRCELVCPLSSVIPHLVTALPGRGRGSRLAQEQPDLTVEGVRTVELAQRLVKLALLLDCLLVALEDLLIPLGPLLLLLDRVGDLLDLVVDLLDVVLIRLHFRLQLLLLRLQLLLLGPVLVRQLRHLAPGLAEVADEQVEAAVAVPVAHPDLGARTSIRLRRQLVRLAVGNLRRGGRPPHRGGAGALARVAALRARPSAG